MTKWRQTWMSMADGDAVQYEKLKGLDIWEFWPLFDRWKEEQTQKLKHYEEMRRKR
jgi:hypothetical protein